MEVRQAFTRRPPPRRNRLIREELKPAAVHTNLQSAILHAMLMVLGIGLGVMVFPYLQQQMNQPVAKVLVTGDLFFLERREIMDQIPVFQGDRLLDVNLQAIQKQLEKMPWIYSAHVSRQWPDSIHITVVEQKPIAFWNETQLLNQYGHVFERSGKPINNLPLLFGISGNEMNVIQRFQEFSQLLAPLGMKIIRLQQNEQMAWTVETDKGIRLELGSSQALEKMQRFVFLYQNQLQNAPRAVAVVDLRYNNGAAVSWKAVQPEVDTSTTDTTKS